VHVRGFDLAGRAIPFVPAGFAQWKTVPLSSEEEAAEEPKLTSDELRREQATSISETRVAVSEGRIVASQGFVVAKDRRSALLDPGQIRDLAQSGSKTLEIFLEWELSNNRCTCYLPQSRASLSDLPKFTRP
jgi:hypothetical protein